MPPLNPQPGAAWQQEHDAQCCPLAFVVKLLHCTLIAPSSFFALLRVQTLHVFFADACQFSPGRLPQAITVAASDDTDKRWQNSNFGACVSLYAPGADVRSAYNNATNGYRLASGTSMAAPLAAGVAALHLQRYPAATQVEVWLTPCLYTMTQALGRIDLSSPWAAES